MDDQKEPPGDGKKENNLGDDAAVQGGDDGDGKDTKAINIKRQKRAWGRRERRRLKEFSHRSQKTPTQSATPSKE